MKPDTSSFRQPSSGSEKQVESHAVIIQPLAEEHYAAVKDIYEQGIATGQATFQTTAPTWRDWNESHLAHSRIVATINESVVGWAALTPVSGRCVYAGVAEISIYVDGHYRGRGIGKLLLEHLIAESEAHNIWTLQAGIFPENTSSLKLHEALGFRKIGFRERIGQLKGVWRD
ncbi:MAG TPA: GNAT family N-acetyltransferase, partial [Chryseolinea sp.]